MRAVKERARRSCCSCGLWSALNFVCSPCACYKDINLDKMDGLLARCPDAVIFHGVSPFQAAALMYGARGGITGASNCLCAPLVKVHELVKAGKPAEAVANHQKPFNRANEVQYTPTMMENPKWTHEPYATLPPTINCDTVVFRGQWTNWMLKVCMSKSSRVCCFWVGGG